MSKPGRRETPPLFAPKWLLGVADPTRLEILYALLNAPSATAAELVSASVSSAPTLRRHLKALVDLGLIISLAGESDGASVGRPPERFSLSASLRSTLVGLLSSSAA